MAEMPKRARLTEVAALAGVSVATASQALNGRAVSEDARTRVRAAARSLGYVPNAIGKSLRTGNAGQIGMWIVNDNAHEVPVDESSPVLAGLVLGALSELGGSPFRLQVQTLAWPESSWRTELREAAASGGFAGMIVAAQWKNSGSWVHDLADSGVPLVVINDHQVPARGCVAADNALGVRLAVEHLYSLGHRRIAQIAGPSGHMEADLRLSTFYQVVANLGCFAPSHYVARREFSVQGGVDGAESIFAAAGAERPTAVVCSTDIVAAGAIKGLNGLGLRVPEDVSVVGFDDVDVALATNPTLTTIKVSHVALGRLAGRAVLGLIDDPGRAAETQLLPVQLVRRDSTAPVMA